MRLICSLIICALFAVTTMARNYNIIPQPKEIIDKEGTFVFASGAKVFAKGDANVKVAQFFIKKLNASTGLNLTLTANKKEAQILLLAAKSIKGKEAYKLSVTPQTVVAEASTNQGLFYAMQTFMQLLPPQVESATVVNGVKWEAPAVVINDEPRFEYRSFMLDPCRHFLTVDEVKKQLDIMAMYKANNMHFHLTEDQGWRVEIKKHPDLTKIGATAIGRNRNADGNPGPERYYYTQEELKELVAYAQERFINIIPEFEMPGHELAAIATYPWLSCRNVETAPRKIWGVEDIVMCPGKETTFKFLEEIVDELVEIFPSKYFHIGGDESPRGEWKKCPLCQKKADELGFKSDGKRSREAQLQSYVVTRMEKYLNKYGKAIIGWDEILEGGGLNQSAIVMSWRGVQGGIQAAKSGHKAIMSPSSAGYYLDYYEGDRALEPVAPTYTGSVPLSMTYNYEPIAPELEGEYEKYILGPQGNIWSEYMPTAEVTEFRMYPRIVAIMETGWSQRSAKNFADFSRRLDGDSYLRLLAHGAKVNVPIPEQPEGSCDFVAFTDKAELTFRTTRPEKMYYTTDGTDPTTQSTLYTAPVSLTKNTTLKIATILPSGVKSPVRTIIVEKQALKPAVKEPDTLASGLKVQVARGLFSSRFELANVEKWEDKTTKSLEEVPHIGGIGDYSAIAQGLVRVPQDGVWYFHSNYSEVWVDGIKVVDNTDNWVLDGERGGRSIALSAGLHEIKVVFLGYYPDGRPTYWDSGRITWRHESQNKFEKIKAEQVFQN